MDVSEAVANRKSTRAFLPDPISDDTLTELLTKASRAPSGGNLQPWRIFVVNGDSMGRLHQHLDASPPMELPGYDIYPPELWEPYRTNRFAVGEQMYAKLGIAREDKEGRLKRFAANGSFFGAPAAIFCYVDRGLGLPQWSDLGMFLQTFMLLAEEAGLATCPQEYWTVRQEAVGSFVEAPSEWMLFCGVAIGTPDAAAPVNELESERMPLADWATFV